MCLLGWVSYLIWTGPYFDWKTRKLKIIVHEHMHAYTHIQCSNVAAQCERVLFLFQCKYFLLFCDCCRSQFVWFLILLLHILHVHKHKHTHYCSVSPWQMFSSLNCYFDFRWTLCVFTKAQEFTLIHFPRNLSINPRTIRFVTISIW